MQFHQLPVLPWLGTGVLVDESVRHGSNHRPRSILIFLLLLAFVPHLPGIEQAVDAFIFCFLLFRREWLPVLGYYASNHSVGYFHHYFQGRALRLFGALLEGVERVGVERLLQLVIHHLADEVSGGSLDGGLFGLCSAS